MTKELLISSLPHETKVAVLEDDQLVEVYFQRDVDTGLVGGIYKGRVNRVLPGMQSAFVDIGLERDAFLYISDFFEDAEEYDRVFTDAENRVARAGESTSAKPSPEPVAAAPAVDQPALPALEEQRAEAPVEAPPPVTSHESPARAPDQAPEARRNEFRGRRQRRRGRGLRESRFGQRNEPSERPHEFHAGQSSRSIEPLPGESLAMHGGAASGHPTESTEPDAGQPAVAAAGEGELTAPPPVVVPDADTGRTEEVTVGASEPDIVSETLPEAVGEDEGPAQVDHDFDEAPGTEGLEASEEPIDHPGVTEPQLDHAVRGESAVAGEEAIETARPPEIEDAPPEGSLPMVAEPSHEGQAESSANAPDKSYTLRDAHHRPRIAPRRGRRGGRPFRGHHGRRPEAAERSRAGNSQPVAISEVLKEGQEILVQIAKEPLGTKGARITSHIALPGRYLVYMPTITHIGVSRKIGSEEERLRLRNILLDNRGALTGGFIVRTAGAGRTEEELKADLAFLTNLWNEIRARADRSKAPALLHGDLTLVERILRDLLSPEFKCIRVDSEIEYEHVLEFVNRFQPALIGHVKLHTREAPLFEDYGAQAEIDKALKPKVWLKSGGYIVINQTEALVAIDVNTGKYVGKTNRLEDTIVKTNIDAVAEIVRQIRLRDLGGIIVIDFIDMDERRNRAKVVQALEEALRHDRSPTKILSFNEFGLVALTRKRAKQSLERTLCEPCPYCTGAGWIKSVATVSNEIVSEVRKMASQIDGPVMTLHVNPQVANALKAKAGAMIAEIEAIAHKEVAVKSDPEVDQERFEIF